MPDNYRTAANRPCRGIMHVVKRGDTLYKLSRKYNVRVSAIMLANPYMNVYNLQVGDELCIPRVGPVRPTPPIHVIKPERPVPPIGTVPPVKPVPPIGTVPPVKPPVRPVPPIGTVPPVKPPVRPVPPIGTVPPVTPIPPVGDLRPPTVVQPRTTVEAKEAGEQDVNENRYDTIDYEYEKFRASLDINKDRAVEGVSVEETETAVVAENAETRAVSATSEEALESVDVSDEEEQLSEEVSGAELDAEAGMNEMLRSLNGSLETFNRYMKEFLDK